MATAGRLISQFAGYQQSGGYRLASRSDSSVPSFSGTGSLLHDCQRCGAQGGISALESAFHGQYRTQLPKNGAMQRSHGNRGVTTMAWGGALAAVRLIVQGKHIEVTDSIRSYVEKKVGHGVQNHSALVKEVDVRLSVRGGEHGKGAKTQRCEVTIFTKKHGVVRAEEEAETAYAAIDLVSDVVTRKLRKMKEKDGGHGRSWQMRGVEKEDAESVPPLPLEDAVPSTQSKPDELDEELVEELQVVRTKYFEMPPMHVKEALENLLNVGHDFYAFRDAKSGEINILYKRTHGGFGLIVPRSDSSWEAPKASNGSGRGH